MELVHESIQPWSMHNTRVRFQGPTCYEGSEDTIFHNDVWCSTVRSCPEEEDGDKASRGMRLYCMNCMTPLYDFEELVESPSETSPGSPNSRKAVFSVSPGPFKFVRCEVRRNRRFEDVLGAQFSALTQPVVIRNHEDVDLCCGYGKSGLGKHQGLAFTLQYNQDITGLP